MSKHKRNVLYNPFLVYCRELAPGTVSLTCDRAQGEESTHDSHYTIEQGDFDCEVAICFYAKYKLSVDLTVIESGIDLGIYLNYVTGINNL